MSDTAATWREYLTTPTPASRRQAALQRAWLSWRRFRANPTAMVGLVIILIIIAIAAFAPLLATHSPFTQNLNNRLMPWSAEHWLGTDELGRDVYSRLVYGTRVALRVIALVTIITAPIGLIIGAVAGYAGGWVDAALMRVTDIFLAFPRLILALALTTALGPGIDNAILAIGLTGWPPLARLARAETLTIRSSDFIAAAKVVGASPARIVFGHVMPLCMPSLIVRVTLDMAGVILVAAGLGFLGLGAQPPQPEWGAMIAAGRKFIFDQWWIAAVPGLAICVLSLGFNLFGDGLRDALDPKASS
ncbi:MAG: ABC transporter permease [Alphaproteobacteria bacterium]|nr:ABC transporter permease [Alphaproteobacteria bacterium]